MGGLYVKGGGGGLSSVATIYGSLFQQKVQREQNKKKTCILCSTFPVSEPKQVISNIESPLRRTL